MSKSRKGKKQSPEAIEKRRQVMLKKEYNFPIVKCPHCGHEGKGAVMKRWHFDNCRDLNTKNNIAIVSSL
jgi:hypothetical protein